MKIKLLSMLACLSLALSGCQMPETSSSVTTTTVTSASTTISSTYTTPDKTTEAETNVVTDAKTATAAANTTVATVTEKEKEAFTIPKYEGKDSVIINGNEPYFRADELTTTSLERYSELDSLGRCGVAYACIGKDIMPTEPRGEIGMVKPSGWVLSKYDFVDGKYLYNRCHLIAFQLAGENANTKNLITGTRFMNIGRMETLENKVASYVRSTGNHVMYRVTPCFEGKELVARGVLMEAQSVEDGGKSIKFCEFVFNVQPGVDINYADGTNKLSAEMEAKLKTSTTTTTTKVKVTEKITTNNVVPQGEWILNTNTKKYHHPWCSSVSTIKEKNKRGFTGSEEEMKRMGYVPCKKCN